MRSLSPKAVHSAVRTNTVLLATAATALRRGALSDGVSHVTKITTVESRQSADQQRHPDVGMGSGGHVTPVSGRK